MKIVFHCSFTGIAGILIPVMPDQTLANAKTIAYPICPNVPVYLCTSAE
jgi:hypothetical protein